MVMHSRPTHTRFLLMRRFSAVLLALVVLLVAGMALARVTSSAAAGNFGLRLEATVGKLIEQFVPRANVAVGKQANAAAAGSMVAGSRVVRAPNLAATFTVNTLGDAADLNPGDMVCDSAATAGTQCTLRAAIQEANLMADSSIVFNLPGGGTINLLAALPIVTQPSGLSIDGANDGQGAIIIDGGSTSNTTGDRIFFLGIKGSDNTGVTATEAAVWNISNLTLRNGNARGGAGGNGGSDGSGGYSGGGGGAGLGGAVFVNTGTLNLSNVSFTDNRAVGGRGGSLSGVSAATGGGGGMGGNGGSPGSFTGGGGGGFGLGANGGGTGGAGLAGKFTGGAAGGAGAGDSAGAGGVSGGGGGGSTNNQPSGGGGPNGGAGTTTGGTGGFGDGGDGGFGGGGGAGGGNNLQTGGTGGYGGGGGGAGAGWGGVGGFGGGGGGGSPSGAANGAGVGGFGGGTGSGSYGGGGGGAAFGGAVFVRQGATLNVTGGGFSGGSLTAGSGQNGGGNGQTGGAAIFLAGSATYTVATGQTVTISDTIGGGTNALITGGLTKSGAGTLVLAGANSYTGATAINGGMLTVNGSLSNGTAVTVASTAVLGGTGTVSGSVAVQNGGTLAPGASPGILNTGNVTFNSGASLAVEINGTTVGTQYDQLNVNGTVSLGNATLSLTGTHTPVFGNSFVIINNDGAEAVSGTFNGLPEGATVLLNGSPLTLSYQGGTGNDVVLALTNTPPTVTASGPLSRQQGSPVSNSTIATVSDTESGANGVTVTVTSANPSNGVTLSNIVNTNGTITANVVAACGATNASFTLTATDGGGSMATATLTVNVTANTAPTLTYVAASVNAGNATTNNPTSASDNGSIASYAVQAQGTYTGTISVNSSGVVSLSNAAPVGSHTITIRATDNCNATTDATFTLTVGNNVPTITAGAALTRQRGSAGTISTLATVNDGETPVGSLVVTATTVPAGLTLTAIANTAGTITANVAADCTAALGANTVVLMVTDGNGGTATANLTVNVTANTALTLTYDAASVSAGNATTNSPTAASDNGNITGYVVQSQGTYTGTLSVNSSGVVSISNAAPVGSHTITIRATDNCNTTTDATFVLTVGNNAPTITAGAALSRQRGSAGIGSTIATVNDAETPVGSLIVTATTVPAGLTITGITNTAGTITANVAADCTATLGANTVVLTVTDGNSGTATANLTVNVTANTVPTVTYGNVSVNAGAATTNSPTAATDNGSITGYTVQSQGTYTGTISVNAAGVVSFSNAAPVGVHTITIRATDNCNVTTDASFTLTVSNNAPTITAGAALTRQRGSTGIISTLATVSDGETPVGNLVVTATTVPAGITVTSITNTAGTITATVAADCTATLGSNTVVLTVTDGNSGTATANLTVNVTANTAPTLTYAAASVSAGGATTNAPTTASDNGSITSYNVQSQGTYTGTISVNAAGVVSLSSAGPVGSHTITIRATDNCGTTTDATFTLTIGNNAPTITAGAALTRQQATTGSSSTIATVSDGETPVGSLIVTATTVPTGLTITGITNTAGTITATVAANCTAAIGANTVVLTVTDGDSGTATASLTVNVTANAAPTLTYAAASVSAGAATTNTPTMATDNGSITGYAVQSQGTYTGTISVNSAGVVSISNAAPVGTHTITIRATDNCNATTDATFTLTVGNNAPSITAGAALTRQQGTAGGIATIATVSDSETPAGSLTVQATSVPAGLSVTGTSNTNGTITATIAAECNTATGANTVVLTVTDANGGTATANLTVNVTANTAPTASYGNVSVSVGGSTTNAPTTASDNGSIMDYFLQSQGGFSGTVSVDSMTGVVSISDAAPTGLHTIVVGVTDNCGTVAEVNFTLNVACPSTVVTNGNDSGAGSLRQIIADACAGSTITFQAGVTMVTLTTAELLIDKALTISGGAGVTVTRQAGSPNFRIFNVTSGTVVMNNLTVTNGNDPGQAGGIYNGAALTLTDCVISGNTSGQAGGVQNDGTMTLTDCVITNNSSVNGPGGGLLSYGATTATGCTFSHNQTSGSGAAIDGSGIVVTGSGTLNLTNCTISNNGAPAGGGGLVGASSQASTLTNCTITNNQVLGCPGCGGGAGLWLYSGSFTLINTIVAGNTYLDGTPSDIQLSGGTFTAASSYNLIGTGGSGGLTNGVNGNQVGIANPLLGALANNGGKTQTCALLPGSLAINAGTNTGAPTADQRGGVRVGNTDIGAFESRGFALTLAGGNNQSAVVNTTFANPLSVTVSSANNEPVNGGQVTFAPPGSGASAALGGNPATISNGTATSGTVTANATTGGPYAVVASANGVPAAVNFFLTNTPANSAPTFTPAGASTRQQGSPAGAAITVGMVADVQTAAGSLTVTQIAGGTATGVTVTGITNTNGTITALVSASCAAVGGTVRFQVSDGSFTSTGDFQVNVIANTPPTLTYAAQTVGLGGTLNVTPAAATDNGTITGYSMLSVVPALTTTPTINASGVVAITNAGPTGQYTITVRATDNCGAITDATFTVNVTCPTISLSPATLPNGVQGTSYNQMLTASPGGGNYTYAVTTNVLPPGLTLNSNGVLSGTPSAAGNYAFGITVTGFNGCTATKSYNLLVTGTCTPITLTPTSLPGATLGTAYNQVISATGGVAPYSFTVTQGVLPPGLTLDTSSGALTGTPTQGGTFSFTLKTTGQGGCSAQRVYVLTVACAAFTFNPATLPNGIRGVAYQQALTVSPAGNYTFSLLLGSLPPGFTLSSAGVISGTFNQTGAWNFTVKIVGGPCQSTKAYELRINNTAVALAQKADYDGDGRSDYALWSDEGAWRLLLSNGGAQRQAQTQNWGAAGDQTLLGDYDGDGLTDLAVFRPPNGTWYIRLSSDSGLLVKAWGMAGDVPVPGDYDGDGKTDLAIFRPGEGHWYVLRSSDQQPAVTAWGAGYAPYHDVAVPGDYDGDGRTDLAVFRHSTGTWLVRRSSDGEYLSKPWGVASDVPVAADYDGDGQTDIAIWRAGTWYIWQSSTDSYRVENWGSSAAPYYDQAVPDDYDGDGQADVAVWRAGAQAWYIKCSQDQLTMSQMHGQSGMPVSAYRVK